MTLTLEQTKLLKLTAKLDLKARAHNNLCKKFKKLKEESEKNMTDEINSKLLEMEIQFKKNYEEIVEIKRQLIELKEITKEKRQKVNNIEKQKVLKNYEYEDIFDKKIQQQTYNNVENTNSIAVINEKENIFSKIIKKIKSIFKK